MEDGASSLPHSLAIHVLREVTTNLEHHPSLTELRIRILAAIEARRRRESRRHEVRVTRHLRQAQALLPQHPKARRQGVTVDLASSELWDTVAAAIAHER